jgi:2-iminobutanoate/2-iminopropanoate deaminase
MRRHTMKKEVIIIPDAPATPYSPAVRAGDFLYVSGQLGVRDEKGNEINDIEGQTKQCLHNIKHILATAGLTLDDVVKVTVFLCYMDDFDTMNQLFKAYFPQNPPARSTAITGLPKPEMLVEIECIAYYPAE